MENATIRIAARVKCNRVQTESAPDLTLTHGLVWFIFSYDETAIYRSTMGDLTTGSAPLAYVSVLQSVDRLLGIPIPVCRCM